MKIYQIAVSAVSLLSPLLLLPAEGSGGGAAASSSDDDDLIASWVQYTGGECDLAAATEGGDHRSKQLRALWSPSSSPCDHYAAEVRAIFNDTARIKTACPHGVLRVNGLLVPMKIRGTATATDAFPNLVCYAELLPTTATAGAIHTIELRGRRLPVPKRNPSRVVVMGDTGCRLGEKHGGLYQSCNNPSLWPFRRVAESVLEAQPDVVVHTGDYIYREGKCPKGVAGCEGSPYYNPKAAIPVPENFDVWEADWFKPGQAVLKAAPLIFIRGNHESCSRAGGGYFRYLHHGPETECDTDGPSGAGTAPWVVDFEEFQVGITDTSKIPKDDDVNREQILAAYAGQLDALDAFFTKPAWIGTHYPTWGWGVTDNNISGQDSSEDGPIEIEQFMQEVVAETETGYVPARTNLLLAAHIHLAEVIDFVGETRPPQLVVANGGTQLVARAADPTEIDGLKVDESAILYQYGFVLLTSSGKKSGKAASKWSMEFKDQMGVTLRQCSLKDRDASCGGGGGSKKSKGSKNKKSKGGKKKRKKEDKW